MSKFILKFADVAIQPSNVSGPINRAVGFVNIGQLLEVLDSRALAPNPRNAKRNTIIEAILATLNDSPELFRFKSKGLLISSHKVEVLERGRFRVLFGKDFVDGVLDGGHNLFAIGLFILSQIIDDKKIKRIRNWEQLDEIWKENRKSIDELDFDKDLLVAVELIYPTDSSEGTQEEFDRAAFEISQARNANTQVKTEAFQNKLGLYDAFKDNLPAELANRVEWKTGEVVEKGVKPIDPRDIVALSWIPLNVASEHNLLPDNISVLPQNIYRSKGECSEKFKALMMHDEVTEPIGGEAGQVRQLIHKTVESCLVLTSDLPRLFDLIYEKFPLLYNDNGKFRFGRRNVVKMYDPVKLKQLKEDNQDAKGYTGTKPLTPFYQRSTPEMKYKYPDALIIPFVTGLSSLMEIRDGKVVWAYEDIDSVVLDKLRKAAPLFDGQLDAYDWDPQRLAKSPSSHKQAASFYEVL